MFPGTSTIQTRLRYMLNDEPAQYQATEDAREPNSVLALINILLLGRHHPTDSPGSDTILLQQWNVLGRAMFPVEDEGSNSRGG